MMRLLRSRRGSAALEFALLIPMIAGILVALTDWGLAIEQRLRLQSAARAGAEVAMVRPTDTAGISSAIMGAVPDMTALSVTNSGVWCECSGAVMTSCTTSCTGTFGRFVRVGATNPYTPISALGPRSVSAHVTLRLQ